MANDFTNDVEMTVALYGSSLADSPALWRRRLSVPVVGGKFAIELSDSVGEPLSAVYDTLDALLADSPSATEWWVGISDVVADGKKLPDDTLTSFAHGKISPAPFAVVADRAATARSSFRVSGAATVKSLSVSSSARVDGVAEFASSVKFNSPANFGEQGLTVTGKVSKTTLDGVGSLSATRLSATKSMAAAAVEISSGALTTLTPSDSRFASPTSVVVRGELLSAVPVIANVAAADTVELRGSTYLGSAGTIEWTQIGGTTPSIVIPDGVYDADAANANLKEVNVTPSQLTDTADWSDASAHSAACTYVTSSAANGTLSVKIGSTVWSNVGGADGAGCSVTSLVPLAPGETVYFRASAAASGGTVLTRSTKELSK